jgi:hypothetical protein
MGIVARKAIGIAMVVVVFGVILLCLIHAVVQLVAGSSLDAGDWIGLAALAVFLIGFWHLRFARGPNPPPL